MLLTLTTTHAPATDLGFLLHKHPDRLHTRELSFGTAHVFFPEATEQRCTAALMVEINSVDLVRSRRSQREGSSLAHYVNDRPHAANSMLCVALGKTFSTAMSGRSHERPDLTETPIPLEIQLPVISCRGGEAMVRRLFEPLGYEVACERLPLDPQFPAWGESRHHTVTLNHRICLAEALRHLTVMIPVLDDDQHHWMDRAEIDHLLRRGEGWLSEHPEREIIAQRYLVHQRSLHREALARLSEGEQPDPAEVEVDQAHQEEAIEKPIRLNRQRIDAVKTTLMEVNPARVLDLGCGEGRLIAALRQERSVREIVGLDVSTRALEITERRLNLDRIPTPQRDRIRLIQGSLIYSDQRLTGFDAAALVEVIEHLDPARFAAMERVVFEVVRPGRLVVTTPNREYNTRWESLPAGKLRHSDHRFEWTRAEFQAWAHRMAEAHGYRVEFRPVGPEDDEVGAPTQMGVFDRCA